jgi:predicted dehydrogenase
VSADYTQAGWVFKAQKAVRYVALYGLRRTLVKIKGQYHMKATGSFEGPRWINPSCATPNEVARNVALIGCGNYAYSNIAYYLSKARRPFLRAAFDTNHSRALSLCKEYGGAYATSDWQAIISDPHVKLVFIASNHASHADYAIACIEAGKHVHIEKPHVVSHQQLDRLTTAMRHHPESKVYLGFSRPRSYLYQRLRAAADKQSGPLMINWFVAGHEIADGHWYFDEAEGGRVLGNLCHWTDLTLHLVSMECAFPCRIVSATVNGAKSDFAVSIMFGDGSTASITFSAKGHTFEGVREILNLHRGDLLANLADFHNLTLDVVENKTRINLRHRDHGHGANIRHSLKGLLEGHSGEDATYVAATAKLFLAVREAIERGVTVDISKESIFGVPT